ncbi:Cell morphogenesis protein PAG1 [Rhizina undulata]
MAGVNQARSQSPRPETGRLERRPSSSGYSAHAHHRQTSIVNGVQHRSGAHSRSGSYVNSPATSPLSPPVMHATITAREMVHIPQIPPSPMTPLMAASAANSTREHIQLPQIPSSPVTMAPSTINGGNNGMAANGGSNAGMPERPPSHQSTSSIMQMQQPPRSRAHNPSHSHHHHRSINEENKTPAEYALHILFTQFVRVAERKINSCLPPNHPLDTEPHIERICGAGVDPSFDKLIGSLGYIARHKPKPVIDSVMFWRKSKSEAAAISRQEMTQQTRALPTQMVPRRNTEPPGAGESTTSVNYGPRENSLVADRRSTISIYILCRVLIEIIGQTTLDCVTEDMADKLEDIIFNQLRSADPDILASSPLRMANWTLFGQLLGVMSSVDFERVTDRFFADLEKTGNSPMTKELETKVELVVRGMSYIKLKFYPENSLQESSDFMVSLARFFIKSHGFRAKRAYCDIFSKLLLPIAATAKTELNHPTWQEFVNLLHPKLNEMLVKPRHWHTAFPLMGTLLCVSPHEFFTQCWMPLVESNIPRLRDKDRSMRVPIVQTLARLTWTYLFRCSESLNNTTKRLERIIGILLIKDKKEKSLVTAEQQVVEPCIQLIRFIGFKYQDLCFRTILFPLLNVDLLSGTMSWKLEQLSPEGMVVGIRAFLAIMSDLEKGEQGLPPFPETFASSPPEKIPPTSTWLAKIEAEKKDGVKVKVDRNSQAVAVEKLGTTAKEYYDRFCEILGKIIVLCDTNFGGQAVLDERFIGVPKTPQENKFSFGMKDDQPSIADQKHSFYELLHVAIQALPRCLPPNIPFHKVVNLLCSGTAHIDPNVAMASANALKSIARQYNSQQVIIGFARFIFAFDERYSTTADGGMLGSGHIENTLKLYIELLRIWLETIKQKVKGTREAAAAADSPSIFDDKASANRSEELEYSSVQAYVEEIESNGLFFLCSQNRMVRRFAIMTLRIITEFDAALNEPADNGWKASAHSRKPSKSSSITPTLSRVIHILESDSLNVMNLNDENLSVAERSRLQRELKDSKSVDALVQMAISDNQYDASLWFRVFPSLIRVCVERCPMTVALCRDLVCSRLLQMHQSICAIAQTSTGPNMVGSYDLGGPKPMHKTLPSTSPEFMIEQWKLYLIVACSTLTSTDGEKPAPRPRTPQHGRKGSKNQAPLTPYQMDRITSARAVFQMVIPLLSVDNQLIREAVVAGIGSINVNLYKTLIESLQPTVLKWSPDERSTRGKPVNSPRRNRRQDRLRAEVTHVFQLTSHFLQKEEVYRDDWILRHMVAFIKDMKLFLNDPEVQNDWEHQKLRRFFCGLTEELFEGIKMTDKPIRWLPFEGRLSIFILMQDWCGHGPNWQVVKEREDRMRRSVMDMQRDPTDQGTLTAAMEIEKRNLKIAALSAMASLSAGPVVEDIGSNAMLSFNVDGLFRWIESIFATPSDRTHRIGRRALKNILLHNQKTSLLNNAIRLCYVYDSSAKATQSYFAVISEVLREVPNYFEGMWKIMALCLFKLGDENADVRLQAAKLLRVTEEREYGISRVQDFEVSIADKTVAVYKRAQFQLSKNMSIAYSDQAMYVFSELTMFFNHTEGKAQRDILHALLPWIQTIDLALEPNGDLYPSSYMVLANLFEITVKFSSKIHSEIQAVWQSLATAPFLGNVQVILDFIFNQSLERREQNFVEFGKQIVVFLSETIAGAKLVEALMLHLQPRLMIITVKEPSPIPDASQFPYVANLSTCVPNSGKPTGFSYGNLAMILMVDLLVGPVPEMIEKLTLLLQVVLILWDHYVPLVQEQAKEMLIHLIYELVLPSLNQEEDVAARAATLEFIETVRQRDLKTFWPYDDFNSPEENELRVPNSMAHMVACVLEMFSTICPGLKAAWGKVALNWATTCPVRHLACRSFQLFRCLLTPLDHSMLADMLARLSNTIADDVSDIRLFAMEILITLNAIVSDLDGEYLLQYPQLFWVTVACLNTVHELEFMEVLSLLDMLLDKMDLADPENVSTLMAAFPPKWVGKFEGLQSLINKGLRSSVSLERTLSVFDKLNQIPTNELVGSDSRLLFAILANLPRFSQAQEEGSPSEEVLTCAERLKALADADGYKSLSRVMSLYAGQRFRSKKDFVTQTVNALKETFFPTYEAQALVFLVGLLSNKLKWVKLKTMELLTVMVPSIDMRKPAFAGVGADLISPLLRLLQTDYVEQALEVLDKMIAISGGPMDRNVIRMSMGNRTIRKEYEKTQTLFGIPDDSGWAIPMPAINAAMTRDNVHAVFYTCNLGQVAMAEEEAPPTPDVQFHMEDYSYTSLPDRTATMLSEDGRGEGGFSDTVLRLGDLDAFFGGDDPTPHHNHTPSQVESEFGTENGETAPQVYDNRVYAILNRSLARTPSVTSFQTSFADSLITPTPRDQQPGVMTPTAFTAPPIPPGRGYAPRSVSSPQMYSIGRAGEESFSEAEEEYDPQVNSDVESGGMETRASREGTPESAFLLDGLLDKVGGGKSGMRRVFRGHKEKEGSGLSSASVRATSRGPVNRVPKSPKSIVREYQSSRLPDGL